MPESITASNAAQSAYFAAHPHDEARPEPDDIGEHDTAADPWAGFRQADMMNGAPVTGDPWAPEPEPVRDHSDVIEEYLEAWQAQNNRAYIVAVSLRAAVESGLEVSEFLRAELDRFNELERRAAELGEAVRTHPTHVANVAAIENQGD